MSSKFSTQRKYRKALETIVYLGKKDTRLYWILKAIYYADKEHLSKYGRQLFGDRYIAMVSGPVPSLAYDIVKSVRENSNTSFYFEPQPETALEIVSDDKVVSVRKDRQVDMSQLSESEIKCLDVGYKIVKDMKFPELKNFSHDEAYKAADLNGEMSLRRIIETVEDHEDVIDYIFNR